MKIPRWLLILLLLICVFYVLKPCIQAILWAATLAIIIYPAFDKFRFIRKQKMAILFCVCYVAIIATPVVFIGILGVNELSDISNQPHNIASVLESIQTKLQQVPYIGNVLSNKLDASHSKDFINNLTMSHMANTLRSLFGINSMILNLLIGFIISAVVVYSLLVNAKRIKEWVLNNVLSRLKNPSRVLDTAIQSLRGSATTLLLNASVVAVVMTILYLSLAVPLPFLLGALTFVAALLPFLLIIFCICLTGILLIMGNTVTAFIIIASGITLNIFTDYYLQPKLLSKSVNMPFIISFLGIISGVASLGPLGILLGPAIIYTAQQIIVCKIDEFPTEIS